MRTWNLVAYDVRDERRLRRTARLLEGHGDRIQFSVFRCRLTKTEVERLRWELGQILDPEDGLLMIALCERCAMGVREERGRHGWEPERTFRIV